jgi:hypothetical protein
MPLFSKGSGSRLLVNPEPKMKEFYSIVGTTWNFCLYLKIAIAINSFLDLHEGFQVLPSSMRSL